jgi:hypothetical protein
MKTPLSSISCAALLSVALFSPSAVRADDPFVYLGQSIAKVLVLGSLASTADYDYAPGISLAGVFLRSGESQSLTVPMDASTGYMVIAAGDEDILDLDVAATTATGRTLAEDDDETALGVLNFTPGESGPVTIELKNYFSLRPGFCAMVVLRAVPQARLEVEELAEAMRSAIVGARLWSLTATRFATGGFCLFGGRLGPGEECVLPTFVLPPGRYVAVTGASEQVRDANLAVVREGTIGGPSARTVAFDNDPDRTPICAFEAESRASYRFRQSNVAGPSAHAGFVFTCLLER